MSGVETGFEVLSTAVPEEPANCLMPAHNEAFNQYIAMHKVLVGRQGAARLVALCTELQDTTTPDHLVAAGWAAAEAAVILGKGEPDAGAHLLGVARESWSRAISHQLWINAQEAHPLADYALPFRSAQDIATLPVLEDISTGQVRKTTLRGSFEDYLNIAQLNAVQLRLANAEGQQDAVSEHAGFGYEANAILAYNRRLSGQWFALPATARSDSGVYHREQTHDVIVIHQERGRIAQIIPVEIKATASTKQRRRYAPLLVRAKMHLSLPGRHLPEQVLEAITAEYEGVATLEQEELAYTVGGKIYKMVGDYLRGERRADIASLRTVTRFHDKGPVIRRHAGLSVD
ncbi:hypothetical protein E6P97_00410 [Patescibacteria group bacterium]|nr:MAG: hypothetical protein E6P97_00410 [Patescibacteria group bacterium]